MGFPYDGTECISCRLVVLLCLPVDCVVGPGPFEALANGCSFIQPYFDPPHSEKTTVGGACWIMGLVFFMSSSS